MFTRKKRSGIITILLCILFMLSLILPAAGVFAETSGNREPLVVGVPKDRCPIFYTDPETKEIVGIGIDLMKVVSDKAGYEPEFRIIEEDTLIEALDNDEYDVVMPLGSALKSSSGAESVVSENLFQTPFTLVTVGKKDLPPLKQLRIGMLSSLHGGAKTVEKLYPGIQIEFYDTMGDCVKALRKGDVDALLHNSYVWSYILQKPSYSDLTVQPSSMFSMDFRVGTRDTENGRATIENLNKGIASLEETQRQAIILDYTSRKLYRYDVFDYLSKYGAISLLTLLLFVTIVVMLIQKARADRATHEENVRQLIDYDPLTGAYSLTGFRKRATELLQENPDIPYLIGYTNFRNFKFINDSYGMSAGDEALIFFVQKNKEIMSDTDIICRIEADHFVVLKRVSDYEERKREEEIIFEPLRDYFVSRGKQTRIQVCAGVYVLTPEDYLRADIDHMIDFARIAEQQARDSKKDGYAFYNPGQWDAAEQTAEICGHLPVALKNGEIRIWYQPQVDYETKKINGAEALCRWKNPDQGWISPGVFIPILEESGRIYELDRFVWETVCKDLKRWNEMGKLRSVSINVSRGDITEDRNVPEYIKGLTEKYGIDKDQLRVEITETAFADNPEILIDATMKFREYGFQVEMDDFGSGFSSLHMLKDVPVDRIKLDLNFLVGDKNKDKGRIIIRNVISMVRGLGMKLIAEGVEYETQAEFLLKEGCAEMQGYYFYKPMPVEDFEMLI